MESLLLPRREAPEASVALGSFMMHLSTEVYDPAREASRRALDQFMVDIYKVPYESDDYGLVLPDSISAKDIQEILLPDLIQEACDAGVITKVGTKYIYTDHISFPIENLGRPIINRINSTRKRARNTAKSIVGEIPENLTVRQRATLAAEKLGFIVYGKKMRKNGRPYHSHPEEVATITEFVINQLLEEGFEISEEEQVALIVVAFLHDAMEEWIKTAKHYTDDTGVLAVSPLLVKYTMEMVGLSKETSTEIERALRLLTHEKTEPWMPTYMEYIDRMANSKLAMLVKSIDILHNHTIDPKPKPVQKEDMPDAEYLKKIQKWREHIREYSYLIYDNGLTKVGKSKLFPGSIHNVFTRNGEDWWGARFFEIVKTLAIPDSAKLLDEYKDSPIPSGKEFATNTMPKLVANFREKNLLPVRF
ncbi:MAG: hypothetical protein Q7T41_01875 [Candidatus Saccharibacteria bacterium]|nr:hypothetical protein [Candidatus Saccharibacteria bacterium]